MYVGHIQYTLPPKSLPMHITVYVIKHACYSELREGQGEGRHLFTLGSISEPIFYYQMKPPGKLSNLDKKNYGIRVLHKFISVQI